MSSQDLHSNVKTSIALNFALINDEFQRVGAIIDTENFESIEIIWAGGVITDGDYWTYFEHGDESDMSDAIVILPQWMIGDQTYVLTSAHANSTNRYGYVGKKRYIRCHINPTNITSGGYMGMVAIRSNPRNTPIPEEHV